MISIDSHIKDGSIEYLIVAREWLILMEKPIKIYRNEDVKKIVACIPPGHFHTRFIIELNDQIIVLQEATVAGLVRAFALTSLHPTRRSIVLVSQAPEDLKQGFAKYQLIESGEKVACDFD